MDSEFGVLHLIRWKKTVRRPLYLHCVKLPAHVLLSKFGGFEWPQGFIAFSCKKSQSPTSKSKSRPLTTRDWPTKEPIRTPSSGNKPKDHASSTVQTVCLSSVNSSWRRWHIYGWLVWNILADQGNSALLHPDRYDDMASAAEFLGWASH